MRTLSTAQTAALAALDRATHVRVKVDNADGTQVDLSDVAGEDFLDQVVIDAQTDVPISACTISLRREINGISVSPLREDSPANVDDAGAYAPLLNPFRDVTVEVATMLAGEAPASGDWVLIWEGIVDDVDWGGRGSTCRVHARDPMARLNDTFIESEATYGGSPDAIEDVIQDILTAEISSPSVTLAFTATSFVIDPAYKLANVTVLEACQALADLIGWNLHWRWNTTAGAFRLTLWEPDRTNTTAAHTFGPDDYYVIPAIGLNLEGIRNKGELDYQTAAGEEGTVTDTRTVSVDLYSTRFIRVDARGTSIATSTQASTMLSNILDDLEEPAVQQQIECAFFWPVELGDLYAFSANEHYDTEQKWAVFGYRHILSNGGPKRTSLTVSGKPSGGYERWHNIERAGDDTTPGGPVRTKIVKLTIPAPAFGSTEVSELKPSTTGVSEEYLAAVSFPAGAVVTKWKAFGARRFSADSLEVVLSSPTSYSGSPPLPVAFALSTLTFDVNLNNYTTETEALNLAISDSKPFGIIATIYADADEDDAKLGYVEFTYREPIS